MVVYTNSQLIHLKRIMPIGCNNPCSTLQIQDQYFLKQKPPVKVPRPIYFIYNLLLYEKKAKQVMLIAFL